MTLKNYNKIIYILLTCLLCACAIETSPTYNIENVAQGLQKIINNEYKMDCKVVLTGQTLWIYLPIKERIIVEADAKEEKPREYTKSYDINSVNGDYGYGILKFSFDIQKARNAAKETQSTKYNPKLFEKMNQVLRSIRRIFFSFKRHANEPKFFVLVIADIENGIELTDVTYIDDLKKASYEMISWVEYRYRTVEDIQLAPQAIADIEGEHLKLYDVDMARFLIAQIKQRIRYKFAGAESKQDMDINKEVLKVIKYVLSVYQFKDYTLVDTTNLATGDSNSLSRRALSEQE